MMINVPCHFKVNASAHKIKKTGTIIHQYHYCLAPSSQLKHPLVGSLSHKFKTRFDHYINFTAQGLANLLVRLYISQELIRPSTQHTESG